MSNWFRIPMTTLLFAGLLFFAGKVSAIDWLGQTGWWSTWLAMAVFISLSASIQPRLALLAGFFFGWVAMFSSFFWTEQMLAYSLDQEGWVPRIVFWTLIFFEAIPIAVFGFLISWSRQHFRFATGLGLPIAFWILVESCWPRVFAWTIGHSQQGWSDLVQIADLGGASLISWIVLWGAALPLLAMDCFDKSGLSKVRSFASARAMTVTFIAIAASLTYGRYRSHEWSNPFDRGPSYSIAVIQEDPSYVDSIAKMRLATDRLKYPFDLVCWPESTLGTLSTDLSTLSDADAMRAQSMPPFVDVTPMLGLRKPLIVGGRSFDGPPNESLPQHQSAFAIDSDGKVLGHYHKRRLMPLGEYVPGEMRWSWLHDWFQLNEYIIPGTSSAPLVMPDGVRVGVLVCFEDIIAEVARSTVAAGAEVLVCIINASAFENPVALEQHMLLARLRSIENRRYLVRVAGTGISCIIAPSGKIVKAADVALPSAFVAKIERISVQTVFTRLGNWPPWAAATLFVYWLLPNLTKKSGDRKMK